MARKYFTNSIVFIFLFFIICHLTANGQALNKSQKQNVIQNIYRVPSGEEQNKKVWIVDGLIIRRNISGEFLYGGNNERYPWIPKDEIWIDNAISAEEFKYTLAHELNERNLMAKKGMSYAEAHDSSLALERKMRLADQNFAEQHEKHLALVSPTDCDNLKQILTLSDSIYLKNIYRQYIESRNGLAVWIVDGASVRKDIYPDFGLSGNDLAYHFIPKNEIWIDAQISCEETEFSILSELTEREWMLKELSYDDAYTKALEEVSKKRNEAYKISLKHPAIKTTKNLIRDIGTGSEK